MSDHAHDDDLLTSDTIRALLIEIGDELVRLVESGELFLVGGAAMALGYGARESTRCSTLRASPRSKMRSTSLRLHTGVSAFRSRPRFSFRRFWPTNREDVGRGAPTQLSPSTPLRQTPLRHQVRSTISKPDFKVVRCSPAGPYLAATSFHRSRDDVCVPSQDGHRTSTPATSSVLEESRFPSSARPLAPLLRYQVFFIMPTRALCRP